MSRGGNESAPKLYIEFEDDDAAALAGDAELVSGREAIGSVPGGWTPRWRPGWRWAALPSRYRKAVAGVVALLGLSAGIGDALAAQSAQRAADRSTVSVIDAAYSPTEDGNGLRLLIDVTDDGQGAVTVTQAQVQQPDLPMQYFGSPFGLASHQQLALVLWGRYDCSSPGSAGSGLRTAPSGTLATTVQLTVRTSRGNVDTLEVPLPATTQLPAPWRYGRATYCALALGG